MQTVKVNADKFIIKHWGYHKRDKFSNNSDVKHVRQIIPVGCYNSFTNQKVQKTPLDILHTITKEYTVKTNSYFKS